MKISKENEAGDRVVFCMVEDNVRTIERDINGFVSDLEAVYEAPDRFVSEAKGDLAGLKFSFNLTNENMTAVRKNAREFVLELRNAFDRVRHGDLGMLSTPLHAGRQTIQVRIDNPRYK